MKQLATIIVRIIDIWKQFPESNAITSGYLRVGMTNANNKPKQHNRTNNKLAGEEKLQNYFIESNWMDVYLPWYWLRYNNIGG